MLCEYPNGRMQRKDGTTFPIACDHSAVRTIDGWRFCLDHLGMVERGCLEHRYTDGRTVREVMAQTALYMLIRRSGGQIWQAPTGRC